MSNSYTEQFNPSSPFAGLDAWRWSDILALAGSSNLRQTARNLVRPWKWLHLSAYDRGVSGQLPRTNREPFLVQVRLSPLQYRCSCKIQNRPCAHVLALLMLAVEYPDAFSVAGEDVPAAAGLDNRPTDVWPAPAIPAKIGLDFEPDTEGIDMSARLSAAQPALATLAAWLDELVAGGFAAAAYRPDSDWQAMSGRLMDSRLSGAAALVQQMGRLPKSTGDWPTRMLHLAGRLYLMITAVGRYKTATPAQRGDLHQALGWPSIPNEEDEIADRWRVLATPITRRLAPAQRTWWLYGARSARLARVVVPVTSAEDGGLDLLVNSVVDARVGFAHGTWPVAARISPITRPDAPPLSDALGHTLAETEVAYTEARCANPWLQTMPVVLRAVDVRRADIGWLLLDAAGRYISLPSPLEHGWFLRSALDEPGSALFGLWGEDAFTPVSICIGGRWRELSTIRGIK